MKQPSAFLVCFHEASEDGDAREQGGTLQEAPALRLLDGFRILTLVPASREPQQVLTSGLFFFLL